MRATTKCLRVRWAGVALVAFFCGCGTATPPPLTLTDAEVSQKLVGKWKEEGTDGGVTTIVTNEFTADGKYVCNGTMRRPGGDTKLAITSTWQVTGGVLVYTIETSQPSWYKKGEQMKDKVLAIDEREFKYRDEEGDIQVMTRLP